MADYAELLQAVTLSLRIDHINNSSVCSTPAGGMGSGPPKTVVTEHGSWDEPDLLQALGKARLLGRSAQAWVGVRRVAVATEGSERCRLCLALARRPPGPGRAVRDACWTTGEIRAVWCPYAGHQTPSTLGVRFGSV